MDCPPLVTNFLSPKIIWYQTDSVVVVRVILSDVKKYYIQIKVDRLSFSTIVNDKQYYVFLYLFGSVLPEKCYHVNTEREIKIYLIKAFKWDGWLRLQEDKERNHLITADTEHVYKKSWIKGPYVWNARADFMEYIRKNNITQILPDVPSTDEEESEDEEMDALYL